MANTPSTTTTAPSEVVTVVDDVNVTRQQRHKDDDENDVEATTSAGPRNTQNHHSKKPCHDHGHGYGSIRPVVAATVPTRYEIIDHNTHHNHPRSSSHRPSMECEHQVMDGHNDDDDEDYTAMLYWAKCGNYYMQLGGSNSNSTTEALICYRYVVTLYKSLCLKKAAMNNPNTTCSSLRRIQEVMACVLYNIGLIHAASSSCCSNIQKEEQEDEDLRRNQRQRSIRSFSACLELKQDLFGTCHESLAVVLYQIARICFLEGHLDEALERLDRAGSILRPTSSSQKQEYKQLYAHTLVLMGDLLEQRGRKHEALVNYETLLGLVRMGSFSNEDDENGAKRQRSYRSIPSVERVLTKIGYLQYSLDQADRAKLPAPEPIRLRTVPPIQGLWRGVPNRLRRRLRPFAR